MVRQNIQVNLMFCTHLALFLTEERFDEKFITLSAEILGDDDLILAIQSAGGVMWKKRLSQKQVYREKSRIKGGLAGASHRWHGCF